MQLPTPMVLIERFTPAGMGASLLLTLPLWGSLPAQAEIVTYDFTVSVSRGSLAGNVFYGTFSYDDAFLTGLGQETLGTAEGLTVSMDFLGDRYTELDDADYPAFPVLVFDDGELQQLDFWIEPGDRVQWWMLPGWQVELYPRP